MTLDISYGTKKIRTICENEVLALRVLPLKVVQLLFARLSDLRAALNLFDLPLGNPNPRSSIPPGVFVISLCDNYYIHFSAVDLEMPVVIGGDVNWEKVRRVKILGVLQDA